VGLCEGKRVAVVVSVGERDAEGGGLEQTRGARGVQARDGQEGAGRAVKGAQVRAAGAGEGRDGFGCIC
jgi:hypothetical protein